MTTTCAVKLLIMLATFGVALLLACRYCDEGE